jgi:peptidoglycan/LPS O-acetylase OafA/YrhL
MSYYLIHQTLAVHLKRLGWPPSVSDTPNTVGEQPWQWQYSLATFGLSLAAAILVTYGVEKPVGKWMQKIRDRKKTA